LSKRYGITVEKYEEMVEQQNNLCAICKKKESRTVNGQSVRLTIDHCHKTGKVRGLLCGKCNKALGLLSEDCLVALEAASYLALNGRYG